ncbi:hypothetical protein BH10PSE13_BH10PSE13_04970 [soil metagenome]
MRDDALPDGLNARFAVALASLIGDEAAARDRLGIAVSGGPDSMALLDLAAILAPGRIEVATVDHGLRPEAATEAAMVSAYCAERGLPHATLRPASPITGSVQAEARAVRYALLEAWMDARGLDWLLTAHHADDQLETMLMRLNRASGVAGLAGIRARRARVIRPLLGFRKADLEDHARAQGLPSADDPSNRDHRFDRARLRAALAGVDWLDPAAAARSAAALADAEAALEWTAAWLFAERVRRDGDTLQLVPTGIPHEHRRRLLTRMHRDLAPESPDPRGDQIEQAIVQLCRDRKISIGACVATGGAVWTMRRAPPRRTG